MQMNNKIWSNLPKRIDIYNKCYYEFKTNFIKSIREVIFNF